LISEDQARLALLFREANPHSGQDQATVEVLCADSSRRGPVLQPAMCDRRRRRHASALQTAHSRDGDGAITTMRHGHTPDRADARVLLLHA
jgi:hypothetical protein